MKNAIGAFFAILFIATGLAQCTQPASAGADPAQDEAAILAVIENESRDFYKKDHATWGRHYVHSPKVHWVCVEQGVTLRADGWAV